MPMAIWQYLPFLGDPNGEFKLCLKPKKKKTKTKIMSQCEKHNDK